MSILVVAGLLAAVYSNNPTNTVWFPKCPTWLFFHLYCPGCGSGRALYAMLHGDFLQAVQLNVLFVAFSPLVLFMLGDLVYCMVSRCQVSPHLSVSAAGGWWLLGVFVGYTILRNLPYFPFTCLAPH